MAWAKIDTVCIVCGREFVHQVKKYSRRDADSWQEWAANQEWTCPECYQTQREAERQAERQAANEAAAAKAEEQQLPQLQGSEKQVSWAMTIRQRMIDEITRQYMGISTEIDADNPVWREQTILKAVDKTGKDRAEVEQLLDNSLLKVECVRLAWAKLHNEISAKWFIDNRETAGYTLWELVKKSRKPSK